MEFLCLMKNKFSDFKIEAPKLQFTQKFKKIIHIIRSKFINKILLFLIIVTVLLSIRPYRDVPTPAPNIYLKNHWSDGRTLREASSNKLLKPWYKSSFNNIFFHETSLIEDGIIKLNARQACAIESAGKSQLWL